MTVIYRSAIVPFSAQQMYDLVNDVVKYPQFLSWCSHAHISHQTVDAMEASLCIKQGLLSKTFTTLNRLLPHEKIEMRLHRGPFKQLEGVWQFQTLSNGNTQVSFNLAFEFINPMLSLTLGPIFNQMGQSLVAAFTQRAQEIYDGVDDSY